MTCQLAHSAKTKSQRSKTAGKAEATLGADAGAEVGRSTERPSDQVAKSLPMANI